MTPDFVIAFRDIAVAIHRVVERAEVDAVARDDGLAAVDRDEVLDEIGGAAMHVTPARPQPAPEIAAQRQRRFARGG